MHQQRTLYKVNQTLPFHSQMHTPYTSEMHVCPLLLLFSLFAMAEKPVCHLMGSPEEPLLSKHGDVIIGGAFSIHSKINKSPITFHGKPKPITCSRFHYHFKMFFLHLVFKCVQRKCILCSHICDLLYFQNLYDMLSHLCIFLFCFPA